MKTLTFNISEQLLEELDKRATQEAKTKEAVVLEAIEAILAKPVKDDPWTPIYAQTRIPMDLSPEEEVRRSRRRNL